MRTRRLRFAATAAGGVILLGVGLLVWSSWDPTRLLLGCFSDRHNHVAHALESAAGANGGQFPARPVVEARLDPAARATLLTCVDSGTSFVWNPDLATLRLSDPAGPVPLVWCPDGSHGRYVGAVLLRDGKVEHVMLTRAEFSAMLHAPATRPSQPAD